MSLKFILGNSGSGKSEYLYENLIKEADLNKDKTYILIVPEQFTLNTQRELVKRHKRHSIINIEVLSFNRLAYRVFDELSTDINTVLEDEGKSLVLRLLFDEKEDTLTALKGGSKKPGYISEIKSLISELMQYNIGPDKLKEISSLPGMSNLFKSKTDDVLLLYESFLSFIRDKYITAEEILSLLKDVLPESELVKGSVMIFDGFTGFTPLQNEVLRVLLKQTERLYVTATIESGADIFSEPEEHELFCMPKKMIRKLSLLAKETGTEVLDPVFLSNEHNCRFRENGELLFLEKNLFRNRLPEAKEKEENTENEIEIYRLKDNRAELSFVADRILSLVEEKGYRYRDIGILCADMEEYSNDIERIFNAFEIPVFTDKRSHLTYQPFVEFLRSALLICSENFSYESVMHFIKTSLTDFTDEETDRFDRYIRAAGIRGRRKYEHPFSVKPEKYTPEELVDVNGLRVRFFDKIKPFCEIFSKNKDNMLTVREATKALYDLTVTYNTEEKLLIKAKEYETEDPVKARLYEQVYGIVISLFDKMVSIIGDEKTDAESFLKLLDAGISEAKIGVIPQKNDSVIFGDIERTRLENIKCLFLMGVTDSSIPKSEGAGGLFSENDRRRLYENNIELSPTPREKAFMQKFYLYLTMTKPSEKLIITYPVKSRDASAVGKSYLIGTLTEMFPYIDVLTVPDRTYARTEKSAKTAVPLILSKYAKGLPLSEEEERTVRIQAAKDPDFSDLVDGAFYYHEDEYVKNAIDPEKGIRGSVSRLEAYAACAYSYYLRYVLKLEERPEHELRPLDFGNLYHEILEEYGKSLKEEGKNWFSVTEEEMDEYLNAATEKGFLKIREASFLEDAKNRFLFNRIKRTLKVTVDTLTEQIRGGSFAPEAYEVTFYDERNMEECDMHLTGKIDRIDIYNDGEKAFIKILDYKSGKKDFDLTRCYYGLSLQLVTYMDAAMKAQDEKQKGSAHPAALLYYAVNDDIVKISSENPDAQKRETLKNHKVTGIINDDPRVLEALDLEAATNGGSSILAPFTMTKSGAKRTNSVYSEEELLKIRDHVNKKIGETGKKIVSGEFKKSPYKLDTATGCDHCEYKAVCGFDPELPGYEYNKCKKKEIDAFFNE